MEITGVPIDAYRQIVGHVSNTTYDSNLSGTFSKQISRNRIRARVTVHSSREPGARRSASGRRIAAACWHAYRDVLTELFERYPDARVSTTLARYTSRDHFHATFPDTAYRNVGSELYPAYLSHLCDCD